MNHKSLIEEQFTKQAIPFSEAPNMRDEDAINLLVGAAEPKPGDHSLDVACGPGLVVFGFSPRVKAATGIDVTKAMLARAERLAAERGIQNATWHLGEAEHLPFDAGVFDIVTCRFAFHHVEAPLAVLCEMVRVTRPGGRIVVCDAAAPEDKEKAALFNRLERMRDPSTTRFLPLSELQALFAKAGLDAPALQSYRIPIELDAFVSASFPNPGDEDKLKDLIRASIADKSLDLGAHERDGKLFFHYPAVILSVTRR